MGGGSSGGGCCVVASLAQGSGGGGRQFPPSSISSAFPFSSSFSTPNPAPTLLPFTHQLPLSHPSSSSSSSSSSGGRRRKRREEGLPPTHFSLPQGTVGVDEAAAGRGVFSSSSSFSFSSFSFSSFFGLAWWDGMGGWVDGWVDNSGVCMIYVGGWVRTYLHRRWRLLLHRSHR